MVQEEESFSEDSSKRGASEDDIEEFSSPPLPETPQKTRFCTKHRHKRNVISHPSLSHLSLLITPITSLFQLL